MTEEAARAALAAFDGLGGLERWIAEQRPWQAIATGWPVPGALHGWRFRVEPAPGGVRVVAPAISRSVEAFDFADRLSAGRSGQPRGASAFQVGSSRSSGCSRPASPVACQ